MSTWYAVMCKPRCEARAELNLRNQGYRIFLPRLATQVRRDGKWVDSVEPLFPRYLFLATSNERQGLAPVRSTLGVSDPVRVGGKPATVPEEVIASLRERQDQQGQSQPRLAGPRSVKQASSALLIRATNTTTMQNARAYCRAVACPEPMFSGGRCRMPYRQRRLCCKAILELGNPYSNPVRSYRF